MGFIYLNKDWRYGSDMLPLDGERSAQHLIWPVDRPPNRTQIQIYWSLTHGSNSQHKTFEI